MPNDLESATEQARRRSGIPLHPEVADWLDTTCRRVGVELLSR